MVNLVIKKIKGNEYLYLVHSVRDKNKVKQKTIKYVGPKRFVSKEEFECMKYSYSKGDWILKNFKDHLSYKDHELMKKTSNNFKKYFDNLDSMSKQKEKERFLSKFISNSSKIEGSTMTSKQTYDYLFEDITPKGKSKKELYMAENLYMAWQFMEKNIHRMFNLKDIKKLHKLINKNIEDETLGKYKNIQNYVGDVLTSSFLFVEERMDEFLTWVKKSFSKMDIFEITFQSHAQFEIIHPFIDGNGRIGRILINWILLHKEFMPLAIRASKRADYLSALNNSQRGKIEAIVKFCSKEYLFQYKSM